MKAWFVYIIETRCGNLYTGISIDLERRFKEHQAVYTKTPGAKGAKFFRGKEPVKIVFSESHSNRAAATRRERDIKKLSRAQKVALADKAAHE